MYLIVSVITHRRWLSHNSSLCVGVNVVGAFYTIVVVVVVFDLIVVVVVFDLIVVFDTIIVVVVIVANHTTRQTMTTHDDLHDYFCYF